MTTFSFLASVTICGEGIKTLLVESFTQERSCGSVHTGAGSCALQTASRPQLRLLYFSHQNETTTPPFLPYQQIYENLFFFLNYASSEWKQCQRGVSPGSEKMSMDKERAIVHLFFCSLKVKCEQAGSKVPAPPKSLRHTGPCLCALWQALLGMPPHWRIWEKNLVGKRGNKEVTGKPEPVGSNEFLNK